MIVSLERECLEHSVGITFKIRFERLPTFLTRLLIWPNVILLSLSSLMFFLPCETSDRPSFAMTFLLTLSVNMMVVTDFLPQNSRNFPRISNYFLSSVVQCATGVFLVSVIDGVRMNLKTQEAGFEDCSKDPGKLSDSRGERKWSKKLRQMDFAKMRALCMFIPMKFVQHETTIGVIYFIITLVTHYVSFRAQL